MVVYSQCVLASLMYIPNFFCSRGEMQVGALNHRENPRNAFQAKPKKMFNRLHSHFTLLRNSLFIDMVQGWKLDPLYSLEEIYEIDKRGI